MEQEGGLDRTCGDSNLNIADTFQALRTNACRMDERVEEQE